MGRLLNFLVLLRARLWVVPAIMSSVGLALAYAMLGPLRAWVDFGNSQVWWLYSGDGQSARNLLGALLSGTMTMTSLVVSLTFVTLTLAANQLGPRLIINFIADRQIQSVLGFFLATILYLIVVMRTVGDDRGPDSVPHLAITLASLLTIACMFALLFYVHKVSRAIIADTVINRVYGELVTFIENASRERDKGGLREELSRSAERRAISLGQVGYVQTIDYSALVAWAREHGAVLEINVKAGDFVLCGGRHIEIVDGAPHAEASGLLIEAVIIGSERSPAQDLEYSIRQLVELALRALSPGVNDPFTAMAAIDRLGAAMELILARPETSTRLYDSSGRLRVIAVRSTLDGLADACFEQIRQAAMRDSSVLIHLADTLGKVARSAGAHAGRRIVFRHLDRIEECATSAGPCASDRSALLEHVRLARMPASA